jgi:hypothetical protein
LQGRRETPQLQPSLPAHAESPVAQGPLLARCEAQAPRI